MNAQHTKMWENILYHSGIAFLKIYTYILDVFNSHTYKCDTDFPLVPRPLTFPQPHTHTHTPLNSYSGCFRTRFVSLIQEVVNKEMSTWSIDFFSLPELNKPLDASLEGHLLLTASWGPLVSIYKQKQW